MKNKKEKLKTKLLLRYSANQRPSEKKGKEKRSSPQNQRESQFVAVLVIFIRPDPFLSLPTCQTLPPRKHIPAGILLVVPFSSSRVVAFSLSNRWRAVVDLDGIIELAFNTSGRVLENSRRSILTRTASSTR